MEVVILPDEQAIANAAADIVKRQVVAKPNTVFGLATGSSPVAAYREIAKRQNSGDFTLSDTRAFMLDEYVGLPADHPQSYAAFIRSVFIDHVDMRDDAVRTLNGMAQDVPAECAAFEFEIAQAGGVDLQFLGIGSDGHIAFNEPGSSLVSRTRIKTLTEQTRIDNARFFDSVSDVPRHVLTQGLATIMEARHLLMLVNGESKAEAVAACVEGPVSAMCPGSIIQMHPRVTVLLDEAAAGKLALEDYFKEVYAHKPDWQRWNTS